MAIPTSSISRNQFAGRPCLRTVGARVRAKEHPTLIDWPVVAVAAASALLFVLGVTATAWLVTTRPGLGSAGTVQASSSSISPTRDSHQEAEITSLPASGTGSAKESSAIPLIQEKPLPALRASRDEADTVAEPPISEPSEKPPIKPVAANCQTFGTSVEFVSRPALAARLARQDQKLLYVLHVSGNFENDRFT